MTGDRLDITAFCEHVAVQRWQTLEDVQVMYWDDNSSKFTVIEFREEQQRGRHAKAKKRRARGS